MISSTTTETMRRNMFMKSSPAFSISFLDDVAEARQKKRKNKKIGLRFSFSVIAVFVFENLKHCKSHDNKKKHCLDQRLKNIIVAHLVIRDKLTRQIQAKKI